MADHRQYRREVLTRWMEVLDDLNRLADLLSGAPDGAFTDDELSKDRESVDSAWDTFANDRPAAFARRSRERHPMTARLLRRLQREGARRG